MVARLVKASAIALAVSACSTKHDVPPGPTPPAEDYSPVFTGDWLGDVTWTLDGVPSGTTEEWTGISRAGRNELALWGPCPDGSATAAFVSGPSTFTVAWRACPTTAVTGCAATTFRIADGAGTLDAGGVLTLTIDGSYAGCGVSRTVRLVFRGSEVAPAPTLASLVPERAIAGGPGLTLSVNGSGFAPGAVVEWNGGPRATTFVSSAEVRAEIGAADLASAGWASITVRNPHRPPAGGLPFVIENPVPTIASLSPDPVLTVAPGAANAVRVTVTGTGFLPDSYASWNGSRRVTSVLSGTSLEIWLADYDLAASGEGAITVWSPGPGGGTSSPAPLLVRNPAPAVAAMAPAAAPPGHPRFTLTVSGSGFVPETVVRWNGIDRPTTLVSGSVLHASIDAADVAAAGSAEVAVWNRAPGGGTASAGAFTIAPAPAPAPRAVAWQLDAAHAGRVRFGVPLATPASPAWSVALAGEASYPVVADGKVFVLSAVPNQPGTLLHALELATGATAWGPIAIGAGFAWAALAWDAGTLYVASWDGVLQAFDAATGALAWSRALATSLWTAPTAADGVVYLAASPGVVAVSGADGTIQWKAALPGGGASATAVALDGVFVSTGYQVYKLDRLTGAQIWRRDGVGGSGRAPAYAGGALYVREPAYPAPEGRIYDGFDGGTAGTFALASPVRIPAFDEVAGYYVASGGLERRERGSQAATWTFAGDGQLTSAPIVIDDLVVVASGAGNVYGLDAATGASRWTVAAPARVFASDEQTSNVPLTGLGAGEGYLVVPAGNTVTAWRLVSPP